VDRSIAVAEEVNQSSNLVTVSVITNVYKITVGKWEEVRARVEQAKMLCEQLGDYRQWGDCAVLLGENAFLAGDIQYAINVYQELLEDSRRRGQNLIQQSWGLIGIAMNNIRLGNPAVALPMLEEVLQILQETLSLTSSIQTNGQLALAYLRLGEAEKAFDSANKVLELAANISPTVYSMDIGFAAAANVYFELWEKSLQDPSQRLDSDKYELFAEQAVKLLRAFEKVFPIGQPVTPYYQGWYKWLTGKPRAAIKSWKKGLEAAKKFKMPYEEGLIHLKLGSYSQEDLKERRKHFERAIQVFEKMGALHELNLAKDGAKKAGF
jgi:tetratricopeptide (TPR) repeat protein